MGNVYCLVWQDNSSGLFVTSYHDIKKKVERLRRRPEKTSTNATVVRDIFQDRLLKVLSIPEFIDDYNYYMGSVNIADQLRSYYPTQQRCRRNWFPLFYWLLDTSLVNANRIQKTINSTGYRKLQSEHFRFRSEVANQLIHSGITQSEEVTVIPSVGPINVPPPRTFSAVPTPREPKVTYIRRAQSSHTTTAPKLGPRPTPVTFPPPLSHIFEHRPTRTLCLFCRWLRAEDSFLRRPERKVRSINTGCQQCNYTLCRECFLVFHDIC